VLKIRKGSTPEPIHQEIYRTLRIPEHVMTPVKRLPIFDSLKSQVPVLQGLTATDFV
jgi:hypothetical protein